ncbi:MAG: MoaD/ThiS family protein [Pirellulales bacterium]
MSASPDSTTLAITVRLFAGLKQRCGTDRLKLELPAGTTVADLREALRRVYPAAGDLWQRAAFARDMDYVPETTPLTAASEWACIPPVSGG